MRMRINVQSTTNRMMNILKQECMIVGDLTDLMSGEELLANRTSEIIEEMTHHTMELTPVELMRSISSRG